MIFLLSLLHDLFPNFFLLIFIKFILLHSQLCDTLLFSINFKYSRYSTSILFRFDIEYILWYPYSYCTGIKLSMHICWCIILYYLEWCMNGWWCFIIRFLFYLFFLWQHIVIILFLFFFISLFVMFINIFRYILFS